MAGRYQKSAIDHLQKVLVRVVPYRTPLGAFAVDCHRVYTDIYVGDENSARNKSYLRAEGITHVLNAAAGNKFGQVDTGSSYYRDADVEYLGLNLMDAPGENIQRYFDQSAAFIDDALVKGGKVLVHCMFGMSRSATLVCAYLMLRRGMTAEEALTTVRSARGVRPNDGFLHRLLELEEEMKHRPKSLLFC
ncbi:dual specificity protein phosphatase 3-like [Centruroides sculpturatus]|uniref:dual specificity protein phosphatase 3-like n=1 Tax=Centruroides sculpturatus TaxID=218467 RepID=UPI000C6D80CC|nr:dual specificity protein phosphatase 3-like [Centruroides sculpturatus]